VVVVVVVGPIVVVGPEVDVDVVLVVVVVVVVGPSVVVEVVVVGHLLWGQLQPLALHFACVNTPSPHSVFHGQTVFPHCPV